MQYAFSQYPSLDSVACTIGQIPGWCKPSVNWAQVSLAGVCITGACAALFGLIWLISKI